MSEATRWYDLRWSDEEIFVRGQGTSDIPVCFLIIRFRFERPLLNTQLFNVGGSYRDQGYSFSYLKVPGKFCNINGNQSVCLEGQAEVEISFLTLILHNDVSLSYVFVNHREHSYYSMRQVTGFFTVSVKFLFVRLVPVNIIK